MAADPVTPIPGLTSIVAAGGVPVTVVAPGPQGGFIVNPYDPSDQGLANSEPLYVDPTGADPTLEANGTTFALYPGSTWPLIPGQLTPTKVNAASAGHKFSVVSLQAG